MYSTLLYGSTSLLLGVSSITELTSTSLVSATLQPELPTSDLSLTVLAVSLFNEYAYVLVLSVHAIVLAIIGPIKLALHG
jgi:NADH:ubiquinone oxidoreductase subunit 6 (subunit J)